MTMRTFRAPADPRMRPLPHLTFMSRWLQLPLSATAIIGLSSIHPLRTFINAQAYDNRH